MNEGTPETHAWSDTGPGPGKANYIVTPPLSQVAINSLPHVVQIGSTLSNASDDLQAGQNLNVLCMCFCSFVVTFFACTKKDCGFRRDLSKFISPLNWQYCWFLQFSRVVSGFTYTSATTNHAHMFQVLPLKSWLYCDFYIHKLAWYFN